MTRDVDRDAALAAALRANLKRRKRAVDPARPAPAQAPPAPREPPPRDD